MEPIHEAPAAPTSAAEPGFKQVSRNSPWTRKQTAQREAAHTRRALSHELGMGNYTTLTSKNDAQNVTHLDERCDGRKAKWSRYGEAETRNPTHFSGASGTAGPGRPNPIDAHRNQSSLRPRFPD